MSDDNWGAAEPLRQAIHDLVSKFNIHIGTPDPSQTEHDKAVADMNAQTNAHKNDAANQSFIKPDQAAKIRQKMSK